MLLERGLWGPPPTGVPTCRGRCGRRGRRLPQPLSLDCTVAHAQVRRSQSASRQQHNGAGISGDDRCMEQAPSPARSRPHHQPGKMHAGLPRLRMRRQHRHPSIGSARRHGGQRARGHVCTSAIAAIATLVPPTSVTLLVGMIEARHPPPTVHTPTRTPSQPYTERCCCRPGVVIGGCCTVNDGSTASPVVCHAPAAGPLPDGCCCSTLWVRPAAAACAVPMLSSAPGPAHGAHAWQLASAWRGRNVARDQGEGMCDSAGDGGMVYMGAYAHTESWAIDPGSKACCQVDGVAACMCRACGSAAAYRVWRRP
jgi:hypothetical protein